MFASLLILLALMFQAGPGQQQRQPPAQQPTPTPVVTTTASQPSGPGGRAQAQPSPSPSPEESPVVTKHEIRAGSRVLRYTATSGMMPIKNREGDTYFAAHYTLHHISLDPTLLRNISTSYYEAGHMMYIDEKSLSKLRADVEKFMQDSTRR
jgi:carboxypeptidase C (cathepsin A)